MSALSLGLGLGVALAASSAAAAAKGKPTTVQALMQRKLAAAQDVLHGLVVEDYPLIEQSAADLAAISRATTWYKVDVEDFLLHARSFRDAAEILEERAKRRDLDGSAAAYVQVVLQCTQCHRNVRQPPAPKTR